MGLIDLSRLERFIEVIPSTTKLYRIYRAKYRARPIHFDTTAGICRFNTDIGTVYFGLSMSAAVSESLLHASAFAQHKFVTPSDLHARGLIVARAPRPLRALRLQGNALAALGFDSSITSTNDYARTCFFAQRVCEKTSQIDGIVWRSRVDDDERCIAVFNRPGMDFSIVDRGLLDERANFTAVRAILDAHGYMIPPRIP